jgi:hypothetical protein
MGEGILNCQDGRQLLRTVQVCHSLKVFRKQFYRHFAIIILLHRLPSIAALAGERRISPKYMMLLERVNLSASRHSWLNKGDNMG